MTLLIPYSRGDLVSMLYDQAIVETEAHEPEGTRITAHIPKHLLAQVEPFLFETVHS